MSAKTRLRDEFAADGALDAINPNDGNEVIAAAIADASTTRSHQPPYKLFIFHDVRPGAMRRLERLRKDFPDYKSKDRCGPCPLPFDWHHKNIVGISTRERERARQWAVDALLLGYGVFYTRRIDAGGAGKGSIAQFRRGLRERNELLAHRVVRP